MSDDDRLSERDLLDLGPWNSRPPNGTVERIVADRVARARAEGAAEALLEAADEIERELVCCDAYERGDMRHQICYWGAAAAELNRRRAARIESGHDGKDGA